MDQPPAKRPASNCRNRRRRRRRAAAAAATRAGADVPAGNQGGPAPGAAAGSATSSRRRNRTRSRRRRDRNGAAKAAAAAGTLEKTEGPVSDAASTQGGSAPQADRCLEAVAVQLGSLIHTTAKKIVNTNETRKRNFQAGNKGLEVSTEDRAAISSLACEDSVGEIEALSSKLFEKSGVRYPRNYCAASGNADTDYQNKDSKCPKMKDAELTGKPQKVFQKSMSYGCCSLQELEGYKENEPGAPLNFSSLEERKKRRKKRGGKRHNHCKKTTSQDYPSPIGTDNSVLMTMVSENNISFLKSKGRRKKQDQNKVSVTNSVDNAKTTEGDSMNSDSVVEKGSDLGRHNLDCIITDRNEPQEQGVACSSKDSNVNFLSYSNLNEACMEKLKIVLSPRQSFRGFSKKKLLILDLNGLLVDINEDYHNAHMADAKVRGRLVFRRPYCDDFLNFCARNFELGIWSSRKKENVASVVNIVMKDFKPRLLFCWDMSKCTFTGHRTLENMHKPLMLKELRKLWKKEEPDLPWEEGEYSPSNTLLVDDSPYKALCNPPHTAIFPSPYSYLNCNDNSLGPGGDLRVYLQNVAAADDVESFVHDNPYGQPFITESDPHWNFYAQIADRARAPLTSCLRTPVFQGVR